MIPVYIFYSMFGFQRTARRALGGRRPDDPRLPDRRHRRPDHAERRGSAARGRPLARCWPRPTRPWSPTTRRSPSRSATSSRTGCAACTGRSRENVFYYLTIYNEPIDQPAEPEDLDVEGLLRGLYRYRRATASDGPRVQLLASGSAMPAALRAQQLLARRLGRARRRVVGHLVDRAPPRRAGHRRVELRAPRPEPARTAYVTQRLGRGRRRAGRGGLRLHARGPGAHPAVGAGRLRLPGHRRLRALRHPRGALRRHFHVDAESIAYQSLRRLAAAELVGAGRAREAFDALPAGRRGGGRPRCRHGRRLTTSRRAARVCRRVQARERRRGPGGCRIVARHLRHRGPSLPAVEEAVREGAVPAAVGAHRHAGVGPVHRSARSSSCSRVATPPARAGRSSGSPQYLNPRIARIAALPAPTERERTQWYFQRYIDQLPSGGEIVLFDRSWYNRAGRRAGHGLLHRRRVPTLPAPGPRRSSACSSRTASCCASTGSA